MKQKENKVKCPFCKKKFVIMSRQWKRVPASFTVGSLLKDSVKQVKKQIKELISQTFGNEDQRIALEKIIFILLDLIESGRQIKSEVKR